MLGKLLMRRFKKLVIGLCWLVGLILIMVATINLSLRLPSLESLVDENQKRIEIDYTTDLQLKSEIDFSALDSSILAVMNKLNVTDEHYIELYARLLTIDRQILGYIEILESGKIPTGKQFSLWQTKNLSELNDEINQAIEKILVHRELSDLYKERDKLSKQKSDLILWTIIFQIMGLVLTQLGTFLELIWKK